MYIDVDVLFVCVTACRFLIVHRMAGFLFNDNSLMISICSKFKQTFDMLLCQINILDLVKWCNLVDADSNDETTTERSNHVIFNFTKY